MAGGKGLRLKSEIEKPLYPLKDKPLMSYVLDNINESKLIEKTVVAVSPNAPKTKEFLINELDFSNFDDSFYESENDNFYLDTLGKGFVEDLSKILEEFESRSKDDILIFINADLPLVGADILDEILNYYLSQDVVQDEQLLIISRHELIFNVNTIETAILTNKFL